MSPQRRYALSCDGVPGLHRPVDTAAGKLRAIGAEADTTDMRTAPECPVEWHLPVLPVVAFHTEIVLSALPLVNDAPSGLQATE